MYRYTFKNGDVVTSELKADELVKRMNRLDTLRVLTEGYEEGDGFAIHNKAVRAFNQTEGFTGIIRLTRNEKDFLSYIFHENSFITAEDKKALRFYLKGDKDLDR